MHTRVVDDAGMLSAPGPNGRYATPTGEPCPRTVRVDGSVQGSGACVGCGTCLLFGGLFERPVGAYGTKSCGALHECSTLT